jgi:hypothetical protein
MQPGQLVSGDSTQVSLKPANFSGYHFSNFSMQYKSITFILRYIFLGKIYFCDHRSQPVRYNKLKRK